MAISAGEFIRRVSTVLEQYEAMEAGDINTPNDPATIFQQIVELTEHNIEGFPSESSCDKTTLEQLQGRMRHFKEFSELQKKITSLGNQLIHKSLNTRNSAISNPRNSVILSDHLSTLIHNQTALEVVLSHLEVKEICSLVAASYKSRLRNAAIREFKRREVVLHAISGIKTVDEAINFCSANRVLVVDLSGFKDQVTQHHLKRILSLPDIRKLFIQSRLIGDAGAKAIADSRTLRNLITLVIRHCEIRYQGARAIAKSKFLRELTTLDISYNWISDQGAKAIALSKTWRNLKTLDIAFNDIRDQGAKAFAESKNLQNLLTLGISNSCIGDEGAQALAKSKSLRKLRVLDIAFNYIGDQGAKAFAESQSFLNLRTLNLGNNEIGDEGARAFAMSDSFPSLSTFEVYGNKIRDDGAKALNESPHLTKCRIITH